MITSTIKEAVNSFFKIIFMASLLCESVCRTHIMSLMLFVALVSGH